MTYCVTMPLIGCFDHWREQARIALSHDISPENINWNGEDGGLFSARSLPGDLGSTSVKVPSAFLDLAKSIIWHSEPQRFSFLYQALWRIAKNDEQPLSAIDLLGAKLQRLAKSVRRDIHKMHAFVRFQEIATEGERRRFIAWFEPEHFITEPASPFFAARFADMDWVIATPNICASYEGGKLQLSEYQGKPLLPGDDIEALWATYFSSIFNPARIKLDAMRSEMPKKYWKNMPETRLIPEMLANAQARVEMMRSAMPTNAPVAATRISSRYRANMPAPVDRARTLSDLTVALQKCRRCNLCEMATQAVPGVGTLKTDLMIVGEQPGDEEDLQGKPFVGPAGQLLTTLLSEAKIERDEIYLTNAVKHFKFKVNGTRRIHDSPGRAEIDHCRWWLQQELAMIQPKVVLALGASAAYGLTGAVKKHSERRGRIEQLNSETLIIYAWHPAYVLRLQNGDAKANALRQLKEDIATARLKGF